MIKPEVKDSSGPSHFDNSSMDNKAQLKVKSLSTPYFKFFIILCTYAYISNTRIPKLFPESYLNISRSTMLLWCSQHMIIMFFQILSPYFIFQINLTAKKAKKNYRESESLLGNSWHRSVIIKYNNSNRRIEISR